MPLPGWGGQMWLGGCAGSKGGGQLRAERGGRRGLRTWLSVEHRGWGEADSCGDGGAQGTEDGRTTRCRERISGEAGSPVAGEKGGKAESPCCITRLQTRWLPGAGAPPRVWWTAVAEGMREGRIEVESCGAAARHPCTTRAEQPPPPQAGRHPPTACAGGGHPLPLPHAPHQQPAAAARPRATPHLALTPPPHYCLPPLPPQHSPPHSPPPQDNRGGRVASCEGWEGGKQDAFMHVPPLTGRFPRGGEG